jgi:hypothetical protein
MKAHRNSGREITWPLSASPLPLYGGFDESGPYCRTNRHGDGAIDIATDNKYFLHSRLKRGAPQRTQ